MSSASVDVTKMSPIQLVLITTMAMLAFATNSLLCREALASGQIGASSFTMVRIVSGAVVLVLLLLAKSRSYKIGGSWLSAAALFGYASAFSYAYISLSAGTGALLLFGAVQVTMIIFGLWTGERLNPHQVIGVVTAAAGLVWLMLPGIESPTLLGAVLMMGAGISWGVYSLLGSGVKDSTAATAGNFIRAIPFALILFLVLGEGEHVSAVGFGYAVASGALASAIGYTLWYKVMPVLSATTAATVQLSVPILATLGGALLLEEVVTLRFGLASVSVLGGIALFVLNRRSA